MGHQAASPRACARQAWPVEVSQPAPRRQRATTGAQRKRKWEANKEVEFQAALCRFRESAAREGMSPEQVEEAERVMLMLGLGPGWQARRRRMAAGPEESTPDAFSSEVDCPPPTTTTTGGDLPACNSSTLARHCA